MGDQKPRTPQGPTTLNDNAVGPDSRTARRWGNGKETPGSGPSGATVAATSDTSAVAA